jgi:muramidase (phage lysozyme)/plastocyanin
MWSTDPETVSEKENNKGTESSGNQHDTGAKQEPVAESGAASAELLVCDGAKCTCDKAVDPSPKSLKVLSHHKYVINDNGESKLLATNKENALPNLNFGQCKVPNPNYPVPCTAKLEWKDYYDHVELPGGAYVLTEKSTAKCTAKGGTIKIVQHGQQAEVSTAEVEKANAGAWAADGPLVTEEIIKTEQAANNSDTDGASVKSVESVLYPSDQPLNTPVEFKANFNGKPTDAEKQGVNWIIYDANGKPMQFRTDVGEKITITFKEAGTYLIEAYGKKAGDKKVTKPFHIKANEIDTVTTIDGSLKVRTQEAVEFKLKSLFPGIAIPGNTEAISWTVTKNKGAGVPSLLNQTGPVTQVICNDEASYVVTAYFNGVAKQSKLIEALKNGIQSVSASRASARVKDSIKFTVKDQFKILPARESEKALVKWQCTDAKGKLVADFSSKMGESIDYVFEHPGEYTVQPFMVKASSKVAVKVIIAQPTLLSAQWEYPEGRVKDKTGWNELNHAAMVFQAAEGLIFDLEYGYLNKDNKAKPLHVITGLKIPESQVVNLKGCDFNTNRDKYSKEIKAGDLFYFKVNCQSKGYEIINAAVMQPQKKLQLVTGEQIVSIEFLKAGKPVMSAEYGDKMQCRVRTRNLSATKLRVKICRQESRMGVDIFRGDTPVLNEVYPIPAGGLVQFDFVLDKSWEKSYSEKLHSFYVVIDEVEVGGLRSTLMVFKNGVPANGGKAMAGVEKVKGKAINKDGICDYEAKVRAFMRMIRVGEGTEDEAGYTRIVGGSTFADHGKDMSSHPKVYIKAHDSTAAGAYQITKTNWNDDPFVKWRNKNNIHDFNAVSQDKYCFYLLKEKKKAIELIKSGDIKGAINKAKGEWASLPGAGYGQREEKLTTVLKKYDDYYQQELKGKTTLHIENGFLKEFGDNCCEGGKPITDITTGVTIRLVRKWETKNSTIGEFTIDGSEIKGFILEEKGPDTTVSGIEQRVPVGTYNLEWHNGTKKKNVLKLSNDEVPASRAILIHSGNDANDTEGCLLAGSTRSKDFVGESKTKLSEINNYVKLKGIKGARIIITANYE